ncbi:MAG: hypothetical protein IT564_11365 [Rhodospirillales bacterium]|nr:hypothetical protein [Rhodospirillales bacterium]
MTRQTEYKVGPTGDMRNRTAEEQINGACMADMAVWGKVTMLGLKPEHYDDTRSRIVADAIWQCREGIKPVESTRANVWQRIVEAGKDSLVDENYLRRIDDEAYSYVINAAEEHARSVIGLYQAREAVKLLMNTLEAIRLEPGKTVDILGALTERATQITVAASMDIDYSMGYWARNRSQEVEIPQGKPCRFEFVNRKAFGQPPAMWNVLLAPPKRYKTTIMRNLLLNDILGATPEYIAGLYSPDYLRSRCLNSHGEFDFSTIDFSFLDPSPISWFTMDGTHKQAKSAIHAISATAMMQAWGMERFIDDTVFQNGVRVPVRNDLYNGITYRSIEKNMRHPDQHLAIEFALALHQHANNVIIRDQSSGFPQISRMISYLHRDITLHHSKRGDKPAILVMDYAQGVQNDMPARKNAGWADADLEVFVRKIPTIVRSNGVTAYVLSQPPGEHVKDDDGIYDDDAAYIKDMGGNALLRECDYGYTLKVRSENVSSDTNPRETSTVKMVLRESRWSGRGNCEFDLIPANGLIVNPGKQKGYQALEGY